MLVIALVAIAETIYVGILGTTQLAAIALVFPMVMLMQMLSAGAMGGGVSSAISRALGAGDEARAAALALHAPPSAPRPGSAFSLLFVGFGPAIFRASGARGAVLDQALVYASVALTGAMLIWLAQHAGLHRARHRQHARALADAARSLGAADRAGRQLWDLG